MSEQQNDVKVENNTEAQRFEARLDGHLAMAEYSLTGEGMRFTHTVVPPELGGRGIGSQLAKAGMDHCRAHGLAVLPDCSFIAGYIKKHPECHDLLHPSYRESLGI